jgi:hypothetical protein
MSKSKLSFGKGNAKVGDRVYTFSLPAGHTCPFANECFSRADKLTGKIKDGPNTVFRCFAASMEARLPSIRKSRWNNLDLLRKAGLTNSNAMRDLILASIPRKAKKVRIHVAGDFFNPEYLRAWVLVARARPDVLFYAYTKSIPLVMADRGLIPFNLVITASIGGKADHMITGSGLQSARVVYSEQEAKFLGLPIDHDDTHAQRNGGSFALLIHGTQPAGSKAAKALAELNKALN